MVVVLGKGRGGVQWGMACCIFCKRGSCIFVISKVHSLCAIELKGKKQPGHKISFPSRNSDIACMTSVKTVICLISYLAYLSRRAVKREEQRIGQG